MLLYVTHWALTSDQFSLRRHNRPFSLIRINTPVDYQFYSLCKKQYYTESTYYLCFLYVEVFLNDQIPLPDRPPSSGDQYNQSYGNRKHLALPIVFSLLSLTPFRPPTFSLSLSLSLCIFLYLPPCLSPFLPICAISDVHLFVQIIRCRDLRVWLKKTPGMVIRVGLLEMRMWLVPDCVVLFFPGSINYIQLIQTKKKKQFSDFPKKYSSLKTNERSFE